MQGFLSSLQCQHKASIIELFGFFPLQIECKSIVNLAYPIGIFCEKHEPGFIAGELIALKN